MEPPSDVLSRLYVNVLVMATHWLPLEHSLAGHSSHHNLRTKRNPLLEVQVAALWATSTDFCRNNASIESNY